MIEPDIKYNFEGEEKNSPSRNWKRIAKVIKGVNDLQTVYPEVAAEWDYAGNGTLTPDMVTTGSGRKVSWVCKLGHTWTASIAHRTRDNSNCPYCCGRYPIIGETDLSTTHPHLITEWDSDKNNDLRPEHVSSSSSKKVWWKCGKGHSWQATVQHRADRGNNCPYCYGRYPIIGENDLSTTHPWLLTEWDYSKNESLLPEMVSYGSDKEVWWICEKKHSWQTSVSHRAINNSKCPYCMGNLPILGGTDLATTHNHLTSEWDYDRNKGLTPEMISCGSAKRVWWKCKNGHSWAVSVRHRAINNAKCPYCSGKLPISGETDLQTTHPHLIEEWDFKKNENVTPDKISYGSTKKVWWKCEKGHSWKCSINMRTSSNTKCPYCYGRRKYKKET